MIKNESIEIIPIGKIKPDPDQPRKTIDEKDLEVLTVSIKNEGLINPIEIDENFMIITGERRWRASKLAGLDSIKARIMPAPTVKNRFIRQAQENFTHNTMAALETAMTLDKVRVWLEEDSRAAREPKKSHTKDNYNEGSIRKLHELFGLSQQTIRDFLNLLGIQGELREALKDPNFSWTKIPEIRFVPQKYKDKVEHLVATQKSISRDVIREIAKSLRRADKYGEDDNAIKILDQDYEKTSTTDSIIKINKIVPTEESRFQEPAEAMKWISEKTIEIMKFLEEHPLDGFDPSHKSFVIKDLNGFGYFLGKYLKQGRMLEKESVKLIEKTKTS